MSRPPVTPPLPGEAHKNLTSLATGLGKRGMSFSVSTLSQWKARYDDFPATLHEELFIEFIARHQLGGKGRPKGSYEDARNRKMTADAILGEIKIAKEMRKVLDADEVSDFLNYCSSKTKSALFQMVAETAPKCAGLEAGAIRGIMRGAADAVCLSMQTTFEDWQAEQEEARKAAEKAAEAHENNASL